jgi:cation diffusion facilitator family transporter
VESKSFSFWRDDEGRAMLISLAGGFLIIGVKVGAYLLSGSLAVMADMIESLVHNLAVGFAAYCMWYSRLPADRNHLYGHGKIQFFSAGLEGALICSAALLIWVESFKCWFSGYELLNVSQGIGLVIFAMLFNLALGWYLLKKGQKKNSIILKANGKHVLSDSVTTFCAMLGLIAASVTGLLVLDLLVALAGGVYILFVGLGLLRESFKGLMDEADDEVDRVIRNILKKECDEHGLQYHALRHRSEGNRHWLELHLVFEKNTTLDYAHDMATHLEEVLKDRFENPLTITTHLEPEH